MTKPSTALGRRGALVLGAGAATAVTGSGVLSTASAATTTPVDYTPGSYPKTTVLAPADLHIVNRFSYGLTPTLRDEVLAAGGALTWFEQQLNLAATDDVEATAVRAWFPFANMTPQELMVADFSNTAINAGTYSQDYARYTLARRIVAKRQVAEKIREFCEDVLHTAVTPTNVAHWRFDYGDVIAKHSLGKFSDMLKEAIVHGAMLTYLNGDKSTKAHPNENLARELLELHTVGLGNYTEDDIKAAARVLTGYTIRAAQQGVPYAMAVVYDPAIHATGPVKVMGFNDANGEPDGQAVYTALIDYLAHHPATARRFARRMATKFVSDNPSQGLIETLAKAYLDNDTAIVPVFRALVRHPEFAASAGQKIRNAADDVAATWRVLGSKMLPPVPMRGEFAANYSITQAYRIGLAPFGWPSPDGTPSANGVWISPARSLASMAVHWEMASGSPNVGAIHQQRNLWIPERPMVFRDCVDHMTRLVLGKPSTAKHLEAACLALGWKPDATIPVNVDASPGATKVLAALLDSPDFYLI